ncbi:S8 family serine peptidase [Rossellomorea vietnamensis]|uniref:S8 family serine peptidase n=1 Tax=Rossellomorea aquimaris TaxID=189382 RepID=A0A5D4TLJ3_9BACI|nr:S8 family serine peptidase [Rossellomorea aquimaris]TYS75799.1 S8 family serine peptidase [Rossellomorea aquimaris]
MKKFLICMLVTVIWIMPFYPVNSADAADSQAKTEKDLPQRVIVQLKKPLQKTGIEAEEYQLLSSKEHTSNPILTMEVPKGQEMEGFLKSLQKNEDVVFAEEDHIIKLAHTPTDPYYSLQWHHETIESEAAWNLTKGSSDVVVAVIDDGVDTAHPELSDKIVSPYDAVYNTATNSKGDHGTHVAGTIASSMDNGIGLAGVAPSASIMPIDVFVGDSAYSSDVIDAIYYAVENGADIINMSLGSDTSSYYYNQAVQYAYNSGVVVIAAAGNDNTSTPSYPASYPNVISVASTNEYDFKSSFSNYGSYIDIAAPGSGIYATYPYGSYGSMSGTSMASPVVAGVAALILANEPGLTNDQVAQRLYDTADDLGVSGKDSFYGNGRVNARKAVGASMHVAPPEVSEVFDYSTYVSGSVETGSDTYIEVSNQDGVIGSGYPAYESYFYISIPKQPAGTTLFITAAVDGTASEAVELTVLDGTAPEAPAVDSVSDRDETVTGSAEDGAEVYVTSGSEVLGSSAAESGSFSVSIAKQTAGTELSVYATDAAGNQSQSSTLTVVDETGPAKPSVNPVGDQSTLITGTTEPHTVIYAAIHSAIVSGTVSDNAGNFSMTINKQTAGTEIEVYAVDEAGNESETVTVIVEDTKAPNQPVVSPITDQDTILKGRAETGALIKVLVDKKEIGTTGTNQAGEFTVEIPKQKAGTVIEVTAIDSAGNRSAVTKVTVQDKKPQLQEVIGKTRYSTAVEVSKQGWEKSNTVFLVNGGAIADGLTATPLASAHDAPILLTQKDQVPAETLAEIKRLGADEVVLVGGTGVVSSEVERNFKNKGYTVSRLGGSTRYETSLFIAKELDKVVDVKEAYLAYGKGEPDALSIAAQSGIKKQPIILVDKKNVPGATYDWLKSEGLAGAYFIGGSAVIDQKIITDMNRITSGDVTGNRISGSNRHDTNAKVIRKFYTDTNYSTIMIAKSETEKLVDALSAGPLAAKAGVPVLLVSESGLESSQVSVLQTKQTTQVHQIGGGINQKVIQQVIEYVN